MVVRHSNRKPKGRLNKPLPQPLNEDPLLKKEQSWNKSCLGVYQCPKCEYTDRPPVPRHCFKHALPPNPQKVCIKDGSELVYIPCKALLTVSEYRKNGIPKVIYFEHVGFHNHARPHAIHVPLAAKKEFIKIVRAAPEALPLNLILGTSSRPSVTDIHESLWNANRTSHLRRQILKETRTDNSIAEEPATLFFSRATLRAMAFGVLSCLLFFSR